MSEPPETTLSPRRTRLLVFGVLVLIALGSIWLIDQRAMQRMREYQQQHQPANPALSEPLPGSSAGLEKVTFAP